MLAAAFIQNSLQRVRVGDEAEVSFKAVPGKIFKARVGEVIDVMAQGQLQPSGALIDPQSPERVSTWTNAGADRAARKHRGLSTARAAWSRTSLSTPIIGTMSPFYARCCCA